MKVYESHQHKRSSVDCLSVRVTIIQLVLNSFIAAHSDRVPSEILIAVNPA